MAVTTKQYLIGGVVAVGVLLLISEHNSKTAGTTADTWGVGGTRPCTVTVTADALNVRSSPDGGAPVVTTYVKGAVVSAERTIRNDFRQLGPSKWAARAFLVPTPGSDCG